MYGKALSLKEAKKQLNNYGFTYVRTKGSHSIYKNQEGKTFVITEGHPLSQKTWKRELKKVGLGDD